MSVLGNCENLKRDTLMGGTKTVSTTVLKKKGLKSLYTCGSTQPNVVAVHKYGMVNTDS